MLIHRFGSSRITKDPLLKRVQAIAHDLKSALGKCGWEVVNIKFDDGLEWWVHSVWEIESKWSPEGLTRFILFLLERGGEGHFPEEFGVSRSFPIEQDKARDICDIFLVHAEKAIEELIAVLVKERDTAR